jgi:SnoaL-like domain
MRDGHLNRAGKAGPAGIIFMDDNAIVKIVTKYMAAWNEREAAARDPLLEACWSDGGIYVDPNVSLIGREALGGHIATVQASRPGARLEFVSGIDVHHNVVRFLWRLVRADGTCGDTSIDFGEVGPDGRLVKIVGFFGAPPPPG